MLTPSGAHLFERQFVYRSQVHNRQLRSVDNNDLNLPHCRLSTCQRSCAFRGAKVWNSLPLGLKLVTPSLRLYVLAWWMKGHEYVLSFATLRKYRDPSDQSRSLTISPVPQPMSSKLYIGETWRRLGNRFRDHLRDLDKDDQNASKPVARHFNLPNHSKQHMAVCGVFLHQGGTESRKL